MFRFLLVFLLVGCDRLAAGWVEDKLGVAAEDVRDNDGDGVSPVGGDCDDSDADIFPRAEETCDGIDNDCDELVDEKDPSAVGVVEWFVDADGDGYGRLSTEAIYLCLEVAPPDGYVGNVDDCDDEDSAVNPGEQEVCGNETDDDCDTYVDVYAVDDTAWWPDADGDGWGDVRGSLIACDAPEGFVADTGDCDEADPAINPGAQEVCDADRIDEDCDGFSDDEDSSVDPSTMDSYYVDADDDRYGGTTTVLSCWDDFGITLLDGDCDDANPDVNPGEVEVCGDGDDDNCDGRIDEYCPEE